MEIGASRSFWGCAAITAEILNFVLLRISGLFLFQGARGIHPIAGSVFALGWFLGFVGGACGIAGLFLDERKWPSILAAVLFPFSIVVVL
jgi:hypothetical protein